MFAKIESIQTMEDNVNVYKFEGLIIIIIIIQTSLKRN